jgi:hypothetical protein
MGIEKQKRGPNIFNAFTKIARLNGFRGSRQELARLYATNAPQGKSVNGSVPLKETFAKHWSDSKAESPEKSTTELIRDVYGPTAAGSSGAEGHGVGWMKQNIGRFNNENVRRKPEADISEGTGRLQVTSDAIEGDSMRAATYRQKVILRERANVGPVSLVEETTERQVMDVVRAEEFSRKPKEGLEIGRNNLLDLQNQFGEVYLRFAEPLQMPRAGDVGPNTQGHIPIFQDSVNDPVKVGMDVREEADRNIREHAVTDALGSRSVGIVPDNNAIIDVFTGQPHVNPFVPFHQQSGGWRAEVLPVGVSNYLGFKNSDNTQRTPLLPEQRPGEPTMSDGSLYHLLDSRQIA